MMLDKLIFQMVSLGRRGSMGFGTSVEELASGRLTYGDGREGGKRGQPDPGERASGYHMCCERSVWDPAPQPSLWMCHCFQLGRRGEQHNQPLGSSGSSAVK